MGLQEHQKKPLKLLKKDYNKALDRYSNMIQNVSEEMQQANYKYVEEVINNCNNKLNEIKELTTVEDREIMGGFIDG